MAPAASVDDDTFAVSETVLKYVRKPGWFVVTLVDGETIEELGRVINIDRTNLTITTENAATNALSTGSYVRVDYYIMSGYRLFTSTYGIRAGDAKIGGSLIPANTPVKVIYNNQTTVSKTFITELEYVW